MHEPVHDVIVIGGGISGLSAAWQLNKSGADVCLYEAQDKVGGCARSERRDGFLLEKGPFNIIVRDPAFERLLEDLSNELNVVTASPAARARYIYRRGRLHAVPTNPIALATTGLLTTSGKCRLMTGLIAGRRAGQPEETIEQVATRRFGVDVSDTMISAVIAGIVAGDIRRLSLKACFPSVHRIDAQARSLLGFGLAAAFKSMRSRKNKPRRRWRGLVSIDGGLGALTHAIGARLGSNLLTNCRVTEIRRTPSAAQWCVDYVDRQGTKQTRRARDLIIAGPITEASRLLQPMLPTAAATLDTVESASMVVLNLGFRRTDVGHPLRGYGFLVPHDEPDLPILGSLWADTIFPHHAPPDRRLIRVFLGGSRDPDAADRTDDDLRATALNSIGSLLNIKADPVLVDICRYKSAIPQYHVGHLEKIERLQEAIATLPGLHLVGNYLEGVSINDCVRRGVNVAMNIARHEPSASQCGSASIQYRDSEGAANKTASRSAQPSAELQPDA